MDKLQLSLLGNQSKGFTLAEVLITLLLIGIVASLTIPALINNTKKSELVTKLKKEQAVISQALNLIALDAGGSILNDSNFNSSIGNAVTSESAMNEFATKLKIIKNCYSRRGCLYSTPLKWLGGQPYTSDFETESDYWYGKAILADGAIMLVDINNKNCAETPEGVTSGPLYKSICGIINIDINGYYGPNQFGRDYFLFWITQKGLYPIGSHNDGSTCDINGYDWYTSTGCAAKVLSEGAMNY